jgi:hypothetical protein
VTLAAFSPCLAARVCYPQIIGAKEGRAKFGAKQVNSNKDQPVVIGESPTEYTSAYGYQKNKFPVFLQSDAEQKDPIGWIKEERVLDQAGNEADRVYYARVYGWREKGQPRFFDSPQALLVAYGFKLGRKIGLKKAQPKKARAPAKKASNAA